MRTSPRPHARAGGLLALAVAPAALVLAPAPAAQAAVQLTRPLKPCYVSVDPGTRERIRIVASGFSPNAAVRLRLGDEPPVTLDADALGVVRTRGGRKAPAVPYQERGEQTVPISLAEQFPNTANTFATTTRVTALSVTVRPRQAATSDKVRFRGRGFTAARAIWGHYVFRDRSRATVRFAERPDSACGTFSVRRRQFPMLRPRAGHWTLQIDQQKHWSPQPDSVFLPVPITVQRIIGG
jgi:hypothetical protein